MANPLKLLEHPLKPTKGFSSSIYSFFNWKIGIFDLAGQENKFWFNKEIDIFNNSNMIICVLDIYNKISSLKKFIYEVLDIISSLNLKNCKFYIFLHKIDLVNQSYSKSLLKYLEKSLEKKIKINQNIKIFKTSIAQEYFFHSFKVIYKILNVICNDNLIQMKETELKNLEIELSIILKCKYEIKYYNQDVANYFKININELKSHLIRLERLKFIESLVLEPFAFHLTNRANWFKIGLKAEMEKITNDKKDYDLIFKDFKRVNSPYVNSVPGTGLGLALTHRLVLLHNGKIWFESELGKGSTFEFTIPKKMDSVERFLSIL